MLDVKSLSFSYSKEKITISDINFELNAGEVCSIVGPNGAGKSTLLKCLDSLIKIRSGSIILDNQDVIKMNRRERAKNIAYVSQNSQIAPLSVYDTIMLGRMPFSSFYTNEEDAKRVEKIIEEMELTFLAYKSITELSGGELQKVMIARALVGEPKVLLLDEPTNNLDIHNQLKLFSLVKKLAKEKNIIVIIIVHDLNMSLDISNKILVLSEGRMEAFGNKEVLTSKLIEDVFKVKNKIITQEGKDLIIYEE
jgi:iron complex transport system ATP-binding protein